LELTWLVCSRWYGWLCNNVHMFIIMHTVGPLTETPWGNKFIITAPLPDKTAVGVADFLFSLFLSSRLAWEDHIESKEEWDDAALYAYRIGIQDSSRFSPFFLLYNRHPRKAIEHELRTATDGLQCEVDAESPDTAMEKLLDVREQYHEKVISKWFSLWEMVNYTTYTTRVVHIH
jgi:hypothetical protein